jgi:hypothetical protein
MTDKQAYHMLDDLLGDMIKVRDILRDERRPTLGIDAAIDEMDHAFQSVPPFDENSEQDLFN